MYMYVAAVRLQIEFHQNSVYCFTKQSPPDRYIENRKQSLALTNVYLNNFKTQTGTSEAYKQLSFLSKKRNIISLFSCTIYR